MALVQAYEHTDDRYILLQPGHYPARTDETGYVGPYQVMATWRHLDWICHNASLSKILAVDFETRGGDYSDDISIVGIGLAWDSGSCYLDWSDLYQQSRDRIINLLNSHTGLVAHNVYFDAGVAQRCLGIKPQWKYCTYSLLAHLANEGHPDQSWGLKSAMVELLGWADSNETELDEWLVVNGFYIGNRRVDNSPEHLLSEFQLGKLKPNKGEMWRAPKHILGKYCVLDAEACYLLLTEVLLPTLDRFPGLQESFCDVMYMIDLLVEQRLCGIPVDRAGLEARANYLREQMDILASQFRQHKEVAPHISEMEHNMIQELWEKEPPKTKKNGEISKNWIKWNDRLSAATCGELPEYRFNIQSGPQLRELLYQRCKFDVRVETESGEAGVGVKALKHMGELGQILLDRAYHAKELTYVEKYIELTQNRPTIHPSFRTPGTMTGRLSSKEPNVQQIPKSKAVMSLWQARPGHVWIDLDFSALEPVVLTEFSQDENLLRIYGDTAPKNDIYLFVAASIPAYSATIRATGYDPHNPTPDALARAKKECKAIRSICKTVVLACQYGAGVKKIMETLEADNVFLSYDEVASIHKGYWDLFAGVADFSKSLWYQWRRNGGYILNGFNRPMAVSEMSIKDILNRFVQSTGHDILVKYIRIYTTELRNRGIPYKPLIIDWHDSSAVEVPEEYKEAATEVMKWGVDEINRQLQGTITLRGDPDIGYNLAEIKKPEE